MANQKTLLERTPIARLPGVQVISTGHFVPDNVVTNDDLAAIGCDSDWIVQRTGIRARRHAPPEMATSDMAVAAGERCLAAADVDPEHIDLLILATFTPDYLLPATACSVQSRLGLACPAYDLYAGCAGSLYGLSSAAQFVASGCCRFALVIGADTSTRAMDPNDKRTYPLFGDGAGAMLIGPGTEEQGMLAYTLGSDGGGEQLLVRPVGGARAPADVAGVERGEQFVKMEGRPVFKWAVRLLSEAMPQVVAHAGLTIEDIDVWIPHQANARIIEAAAANLKIDLDKIVINLSEYGNTSGASIPIAVDEAVRSGRIERGMTVAMAGFGAGLTWGATVMKW